MGQKGETLQLQENGAFSRGENVHYAGKLMDIALKNLGNNPEFQKELEKTGKPFDTDTPKDTRVHENIVVFSSGDLAIGVRIRITGISKTLEISRRFQPDGQFKWNDQSFISLSYPLDSESDSQNYDQGDICFGRVTENSDPVPVDFHNSQPTADILRFVVKSLNPRSVTRSSAEAKKK